MTEDRRSSTGWDSSNRPLPDNVTGLPVQLDPLEFRVPGSDVRGHSERLFCRVQPGLATHVDILVQSRRFPYRTKGDLMRHAVHRHLEWLETIDPIASVTGEVDAIIEILRDEEFSQDFTTVFEKMGERIAKHLEKGSEGQARRLLTLVLKRIAQMPPGYWKDLYKADINSRWGHLLSTGTKASLHKFSKDE